MGFTDWLSDVRKSNAASRSYDEDVLSLFTYKENGIRYFKWASYVRPSMDVDDNNNVYLTDSYEEFSKNSSGPKKTNPTIFVARPKPLQSTNYPFIFDYNFDRKLYYFAFFNGEELRFSLAGNGLTIMHSYSMRYGMYAVDGDLISIPHVINKDNRYSLYKNNKYETNIKNIDPEQIRWSGGMHWSDGTNYRLRSKQSKLNGSSLYFSSTNTSEKRYLWVFDFETTGLDPETCEILEIGLNIYEIGYNTFYNEHVNFSCLRKVIVPKEVEELTHISQDMVNIEGLEDEAINEKLRNLIEKYGKDAIFSSYNLYFDASFFLAYCEKNNINLDFDWLDILTIAKDRYEYPHKLGEIIQRIIKDDHDYSSLDIEDLKESCNSHRALDDAIAAFHLLKAMKFIFDDIAKYIGVIGHNPKYPFKWNRYISKIINNNNGRAKGKILTKVQFFKREYPIYFNEVNDNNIYLYQHKYADDEIKDDFSDIDIKLKFDRRK